MLKDPVNSSRIAIVFPGALGDLICAGPAIAAIARRHSGASIELIARAELARFANGRMGIARGHSIDRREIAACFTESDEAAAAVREFLGVFNRIYSFYAADDARFRAALAKAAGGPVSFHPFRPDGPGHVSAGYLCSIGETQDDLKFRIEPTPEDFANASRAFEAAGCEPARTVVIFPGSGSSGKNWPLENFVAAASMLSSRWNTLFVLGPAEQSMEPSLRARRIEVVNDVELGTIAAVARLAAGFIGNDSGVSHLAAACGARGIAIFGPTDPERWRPIGAIEVLQGNPPDSVTSEAVASALMRQLSGAAISNLRS
ncbi:MAG TPA: glycosyltransferase family 9 protein [Candidatus Binataceae bacterium]|nr:glycosyltransferase family 9 protein [Candidatus Binataceae bacterium]